MLGVIYISKIEGNVRWIIDIYDGKYCVDTVICKYRAEAIDYCERKKWKYTVITD
jgi:hypothetical protein